jgi:hypothetical protein
MPLRDGVVELRQKGASLRMIRELLATAGVAVSTDTIARFLAEVHGEPPSHASPKRSPRRRVVAPPQPATPPLVPAAQREEPPGRSPSRGPRIADPRNL